MSLSVKAQESIRAGHNMGDVRSSFLQDLYHPGHDHYLCIMGHADDLSTILLDPDRS